LAGNPYTRKSYSNGIVYGNHVGKVWHTIILLGTQLF